MECSAWPKNLSSSRKHAIQGLLHGQNPKKKLGDLFDAHSQTGNNTGQPSFAEDLIVNALGSFSSTLSLSSNAQSYEVLQVPTNACVMSEVSEESESINNPFPRTSTSTKRSASPMNLSSRRKCAIKELLHGQESARKLRDLFNAHSQAGNSTRQPLFVEDLVDDLHRSFRNTISVLGKAWSDEVLQVPTNSCVRSEDSDEDSIHPPVPRKTSDTWTRLDQNLIDDGHQWGTSDQKSILNSELPKENSDLWTRPNPIVSRDLEDGYQWRIVDQAPIPKLPGKYRCAHKIDKGCQATKQVEQIENDPPLYRMTYRGHHTCENPILKSPQLILDLTSARDDSIRLSFNTSLVAKQDNNNKKPVFFDFLSVNQEQKLPSEDDVNPHGQSHDRQ